MLGGGWGERFHRRADATTAATPPGAGTALVYPTLIAAVADARPAGVTSASGRRLPVLAPG